MLHGSGIRKSKLNLDLLLERILLVADIGDYKAI